MKTPLLIALCVWLATPGRAVSDERKALPPCSKDAPAPASPGEVVRLFELHKDRNPENVLVVHTYAGAGCKLIGSMSDKGRLVDMYWRMNAGTPKECYKPTHSMIKSETLKTLDVTSLSADKTKIKIDIKQLDQLKHDLPSREAEVALSDGADGCEAEVLIPLGKAEGGAVLRIKEIDAKGKYRLGVPRREIEELELKGVDAADKPVRAVFHDK